ncbi:MAG: hypothetical protein ACR2M4_03795 [Actinomycetota bacterium]
MFWWLGSKSCSFHEQNHRKKLIEVALPLDAINKAPRGIEEVETAEEGLGTGFQCPSCAACHSVPAAPGVTRERPYQAEKDEFFFVCLRIYEALREEIVLKN